MGAFLVSAIFLVLLAASCQGIPDGIKIQDYFEQRCSPERGFVTLNFENWIGNLTEGTPLYFPLIHSLDVLRITQDLFGETDLGFLSQENVLNSCITVTVSGTNMTFNGYCGETFTKELIPITPKIFKWTKCFPDGVGGIFRVSLTDNRSWLVVDVCWGDGQRSFAVISLYPFLSACSRNAIIEHLKAIGFQEKHFTGLTYDYESCKYSCRHHLPGHGQAQDIIPLVPFY